MDVRLTGVLRVKVLVRHVRVPHRRVVVLMLVRGAQVLKPSRHLIVVMGDVEVPVSVHQALMVMLFPPGRGRTSRFRHGCSLRHGAIKAR
jgi:hypothetical protein